jgi:hypothetical protein
MIYLKDLNNGMMISAHRTVAAAQLANRKFQAKVRAKCGASSYIDVDYLEGKSYETATVITDEDRFGGVDI